MMVLVPEGTSALARSGPSPSNTLTLLPKGEEDVPIVGWDSREES